MDDVRHIPTAALLRLVSAEWLAISQYIETRLDGIREEITSAEVLMVSQMQNVARSFDFWSYAGSHYKDMRRETRAQITLMMASGGGSSRSVDLLTDFQHEYDLDISKMDEYEKRIDRISTLLRSVTNIRDSRRSERQTWIAIFFVSLSLIGTILSMTEGVTVLGNTVVY